MMKKIVELIVKFNEDEIEDLGVDAVALVENPAIELPFLAFSTAEEFVEKKAGESEEEYLGHCIPELIKEGYDADQAAAICYSYYQDALSSAQMQDMQKAMLSYTQENGEPYDPLTVTYIDGTKENFSTIGDFMKGLAAIDLLTNRQLKTAVKDEGRIMYRYAGPAAQRPFCRALQNSNKLFTRDQIYQMQRDSLNSQMGHNRQAYSIWTYAGGPNCKHYWEELTVFTGEDGKLIFISHGPATQSPSDKTLNGYYSEKTKRASEIAYLARNKFSFAVVDDEQRIVVGPVLVPNKLIRRLDKDNQEYFVFFSEKTVKDIAEMMMARNLQNNTNVEHNSPHTHTSNTLIESWLVVDPAMDKATAMGFEVPKGTLMQSRRINDDATWQQIKSGKLRGFSVEGIFAERATVQKPTDEDQLMAQIIDILKGIN